MTFRIDKIEIQQQPERKRYWAELEAYTPSGFRAMQLTTPEADGRIGIFQAIAAWCDQWDPPPPVVDADLDALRAEAEAAGVRVDGRWGVERLRQEIASAGHEKALVSEPASTGD